MHGMLDENDHRQRAGLLLAIAVVSVGLWQTQTGSLVLYPFTLLATWFHEMGHGLAAILTGGRFDHLVIFADGSGYAMTGTRGRIAGALVAANGPMGPAIAGSLMIAASRTTRASRIALELLGWALIVSTVIWVRSLVGWVLLPGLGLAIIAMERVARPAVHRLAVQVLGVQAGISVWRSMDYVFSSSGQVGGRTMPSDSSAIADALILPYWFWGAAISAAIAAMLWWSVRTAFRR